MRLRSSKAIHCETLVISHFYRVAANVATSCCSTLIKNNWNFSGDIGMATSAAILSCQHWQISPVSSGMEKVRH